jgi:hypothetical protein
MHLYHPTPAADYYRYYNNQAGFGYAHPGISTYRGPVYQRGNGIGSVFSSLWKAISPLFTGDNVRSALKSAGTQALKTGLAVGSDVMQGRNLGESLKARAGETGRELLGAAADELRGLAGNGRRRRRAPKRKSTLTNSKPKKRRKSARRKKKSKSKPKKTKRKKSKKRRNIFD